MKNLINRIKSFWKTIQNGNSLPNDKKDVKVLPIKKIDFPKTDIESSEERCVFEDSFNYQPKPFTELPHVAPIILDDRSKTIKEFVESRNIYSLCHFTRIENLKSILEHGLWSRKHLSDFEDGYYAIINDQNRYDQKLNSISVSIQYPNYHMFYRLNIKDKEKWVVLLISSSVLWEKDCLFFSDNAASSKFNTVPEDKLHSFSAIKGLFQDYNGVIRTELGIPNSYPTNPQAEVMVKKHIPSEKITCVHFFSNKAKDAWVKENQNQYKQIFVVNEAYFRPRSDYRYWQKK